MLSPLSIHGYIYVEKYRFGQDKCSFISDVPCIRPTAVCRHGLISGRERPAFGQPFGHVSAPPPHTTTAHHHTPSANYVVHTQASLETVKTKKGDFQLLNCDDHRRLVTKKSGKDPKDLRPDIVHQVSNHHSAAAAAVLAFRVWRLFFGRVLVLRGRTERSGCPKAFCADVLNSTTIVDMRPRFFEGGLLLYKYRFRKSKGGVTIPLL